MLKRQIVNPETIKDGLSEAECRLGALPYDLIKGFRKEEIPAVTEMLNKLFSEYGKKIKDLAYEENRELQLTKIEPHAKNLEESLKGVLKRDDITVSYHDSGAFKPCTKIKVGKNSYALSTFKGDIDIEPEEGKMAVFGPMYEPAAVFNMYKLSSHGRLARPFMTRIMHDEEGGEYMLSKFIESSHPVKVKKGPISASREKVTHIDPNGDNTINGIVVDMGGCMPNLRHISDKKLNVRWRESAAHIDAYIAALNEGRGNECQAFLEQKIKEGVDISDCERFEELYQEYMNQNSEKYLFRTAQTASEGLAIGLFRMTKKMPKMHNYVKTKIIPNIKHTDRFGNQEPLEEYMARRAEDGRRSLKKLVRQYRNMKEAKERMIEEGTWDDIHSLLVDDFKKANFGFTKKPDMCEDYIPTMMMRLLDINQISFKKFNTIHTI